MKGHAATRLKLLLTTLAILVLAMAFNGGLSVSSLEKLSLNSLIARYQVVANAFRSQVAQSIRYGKPLERFFGITRMMEDVRADLPDLSNIMVVSTEGAVLYSLDDSRIGQQWPDLAGPEAKTLSAGGGHMDYKAGDAYYVEFPIEVQAQGDEPAAVKGLVVFAFPADLVQAKLKTIILENVDVLAFITLAAAAVLGVLLTFFLPLDPGRFSKVRLYLILVLALGGSQCVYSYYNVQTFRDNFLEITRTNTEKVARLLKSDVDYLLSKGLSVERLSKMDVYMSKILAVTPEIAQMSIMGQDGRVLYRADANGPVAVRAGTFAATAGAGDIAVSLIKTSKDGAHAKQGELRVELSQKVIAEKVREIILDSVTVGVIAILFLLELVIIFLIFLREQTRGAAPAAVSAEDDHHRYAIIRPVAFLFLFAMDMCISFIPLHMEQIYQPLLGLSEEVIMGLPISAEMFFAGAMVLVSGVWTDRRGWFEPFFAGAFLACAGYVYSGLAPNALQFIMARGLVGAGYGLALMATEGFVVDNTGSRNRAQGITHLFAGVYAGSLCGGAAGAMLADRLGFRPVFLASAVLMLLMLAVVFLVLRGSFHRPKRDASEPAPAISAAQVRKFLFNRNVLGLIIMNIMPGALILVGFINFLIPVYLNRIGTNQSDIGRVLMIYGVCLIYMAPSISRFVDRSQNKKIFIFLSGVIGALALTGYFFQGGLLVTGLAALMLGVSSSLGFAAQNAFALNLKVTHEVGHGVAMGLSNALERIGQVLGPLALGWIIVSLGMEKGIASAGVLYLSVSLLFLFMVREKGAVVTTDEKH
ncbi:MAG: MFS transporter [Thermodesulfobacteriota bacterium]